MMGDAMRYKILMYFSDKRSENVDLRNILKSVGEDKKVVNKVLYEFSRQQVLEKVQDSPPRWKISTNFEQEFVKLSLTEGKSAYVMQVNEASEKLSSTLSSLIIDDVDTVYQKIFYLMSSEDVKILKSIFTEIISSRRSFSRIVTSKHLYNILFKRDSLNILNLEKISEKLMRDDITELVQQAKFNNHEECNLCQNRHNNESGIIHSVELDRAINFVYPKIGPNWIHLARALGLSDDDIDIIRCDNKNTKDQAYEALKLWKRRNGEDSTLRALINALRSTLCGRKDLADKLAKA